MRPGEPEIAPSNAPMSLPDKMPESLVKALTADDLLCDEVAKDLVKQLESGKPVTWNLLLNKQLELEKGVADETDS